MVSVFGCGWKLTRSCTREDTAAQAERQGGQAHPQLRLRARSGTLAGAFDRPALRSTAHRLPPPATRCRSASLATSRSKSVSRRFCAGAGAPCQHLCRGRPRRAARCFLGLALNHLL